MKKLKDTKPIKKNTNKQKSDKKVVPKQPNKTTKTDTADEEENETEKVVLNELDHPVYRKFGQAIYTDDAGKPKFNQEAVVRRFISDNPTRFNDGFLVYQPQSGIWASTSETRVKSALIDHVRSLCADYGVKSFAYSIDPAPINSLAAMLKLAASPEVCKPKDKLFLVGNGVLDFTGDEPKLKAFSPDHGFTSATPIHFNAKAKCPQFCQLLLEPALDKEDILLVQRYFGSVLLGRNSAQRILALVGNAGTGKSTLVTVLESIIGSANVAALRTNHLAGRFELTAFQGKRLLAGKDVAGDTLSAAGAKLLKGLTGGDVHEAEAKYANERAKIAGDFHVLLTSNSNLKIGLDGDAEAWRRRLLVIEFTKPKPGTPIPNFAEKLLGEEGEGILAWLVSGAQAHLNELKDGGNYAITSEQQERIDDVIAQSQTVKEFVTTCVKADANASATTETLVTTYDRFCAERGWIAVTKRQLENQLPPIMKASFGVLKRHDIRSGTGLVRGFKGIRVKA